MSSLSGTAFVEPQPNRHALNGAGAGLEPRLAKPWLKTGAIAFTVARIVDLPDGSFVLSPDPKVVLRQRLLFGVAWFLVVGAGVAFVAVGVRVGQIPWPFLLGACAVWAATEVFVWRSAKPPTLKADGQEISCTSSLASWRMPRSDLESIFRGQVYLQTNKTSYWDKSYLFLGPGGKVGVRCSASDYPAGGIEEFSRRLGVPIRGDFSVQVKGGVVPESA